MKFRPCIDLHDGQVKQIVGSSLSDDNASLKTNFVAKQPPSYFAKMYMRDGLRGGHVIKLGPGNDEAAKEALNACPGFMQVGGGITDSNARQWLDEGAAQVIVTSFLFEDGKFCQERLDVLSRSLKREELVLDLSCRPDTSGEYIVTCNRWQSMTELKITAECLARLSQHCCEFLVHAVDVEGKQSGIDLALVRLLAETSPIPVTYAGGIRSLDDIRAIEKAGKGKIDYTVGSALDIFGGSLLKYKDLVDFGRN